MTTCDDGPASASPTCGWTQTAAGARVPASQGFCCACSASQLLHASTGGSAAGERPLPLECVLLAVAAALGAAAGQAKAAHSVQ